MAKSYKSSRRPKGRKASSPGVDSGMGRATAIGYSREGADVASVICLQSREVAALIKAEIRKATEIPGDITNEHFLQETSGSREDTPWAKSVAAVVAGILNGIA